MIPISPIYFYLFPFIPLYPHVGCVSKALDTIQVFVVRRHARVMVGARMRSVFTSVPV